MSFLLRFGTFLAGILLFVPISLACNCLQRSPLELYQDYPVIFIGTVQEIIRSDSIHRMDVRFVVQESWKGVYGNELWLHTPSDSAGCGVNFEQGERYTVLATINNDGTLSATLCSGTEEYQQSSSLMKYLRTLQTSSFSSSRSSSSSGMCEPYICPTGKTYPACTSDGHPIYYFAYPCQFDAGNIFTDVPQNHRYYDSIKFVKEQGIVSGYSDGSFHPDDLINRAEFTKIIVHAQYGSDLVRKCDTRVLSSLKDIDFSAWYAQSLCAAVLNHVISGYPDGTFRPGNAVNFAEAAKIIASTFNLPQLLIYYPQWWQGPIQSLSFALPPTYVRPEQFVTRGEMAFMIQGVLQRDGWTSSRSSSRSAVSRNGCKIGGCSSQLCIEASDDGVSTCEWAAAYACYQSATCERQPNGQCAWTQTRELTKCLNNTR